MSDIMRVLVAGPWVGEFGWELMAFQARVRALAKRYDRVIVLGGPGKAPLYSDYAEYREITLPDDAGQADGVGRTGLSEAEEQDLRRWCQDHVDRTCEQLRTNRSVRIERYDPNGRLRYPWIPTYPPHQEFIRFGRVSRTNEKPTVVLVRRERALAPERNAPLSWWDDLGSFLIAKGIRVKLFVANLENGPDQLASADLAAGASTGGLHLASLCGCPHYVWGSGPKTKWSGPPWPDTRTGSRCYNSTT